MIVEAQVSCPYCGEDFPVMIDTSQGSHTTVEDCSVCCRPIRLRTQCEPGEVFEVEAAPESG